ncbi:FGGY family of carbohydrate kinase [Striga asiatica]|uniref:FGGY family of carbohydrate kinase n=1 Tax=Striga asiatica TaxID=4170 RepID=A0A5A7QL45_STRAF|nr:FGGY family of carbohydrate kinase [Striga asiatica]
MAFLVICHYERLREGRQVDVDVGVWLKGSQVVGFSKKTEAPSISKWTRLGFGKRERTWSETSDFRESRKGAISQRPTREDKELKKKYRIIKELGFGVAIRSGLAASEDRSSRVIVVPGVVLRRAARQEEKESGYKVVGEGIGNSFVFGNSIIKSQQGKGVSPSGSEDSFVKESSEAESQARDAVFLGSAISFLIWFWKNTRKRRSGFAIGGLASGVVLPSKASKSVNIPDDQSQASKLQFSIYEIFGLILGQGIISSSYGYVFDLCHDLVLQPLLISQPLLRGTKGRELGQKGENAMVKWFPFCYKEGTSEKPEVKSYMSGQERRFLIYHFFGSFYEKGENQLID